MSNTTAPERHKCFCGKSFLRKEHLRRHQATHGERAYVCDVCQRSFTRNWNSGTSHSTQSVPGQEPISPLLHTHDPGALTARWEHMSDLLRRHVALHESATVPDPRRSRACDACHANKTKCDGGDTCTLCSKRGIACTYSRGRESEKLPASEAQNGQKNDGQVNGGGAGVTIPDTTRLHHHQSPPFETSTVLDMGSQFPLPTVVNAVPPSGTLSAAPQIRSSPRSPERTNAVRAGMRSLTDAVASLDVLGNSVVAYQETLEENSWCNSCLESFFESFHERWPIVHAPTFDPSTDSLAASASTLMIGSWYENDEITRLLAVELHGILVGHMLREVMETTSSILNGRPWPTETWKAALLNVIFACETGKPELISKARLLHSLLVTVLRDNGVFSAEAIERQQNTHYPGTFTPWVHSGLQRWRRVVVSIFKIDAHLSLLTGLPPLIQCEELDLPLTSTFAMWNAHGLDVFPRRFRVEPHERGSRRMCDLLTFSSNTTPAVAGPNGEASLVLLEDVEAGLLGSVHLTWQHAQWRRRRFASEPSSCDIEHQKLLDQMLSFWEVQLDTIRTTSDPALLEAYMRAYAGREEEDKPEDRDGILARLRSYILHAALLYHLVALHAHADAETLLLVLTSDEPPPSSTPSSSSHARRREAQVWQWANSPDGRTAVLHALHALRSYRELLAGVGPRRAVDPLAHLALSVSAAVVWVWLVAGGQACPCAQGITGLDLGRLASGSAQAVGWTGVGGTANVDGRPLCGCDACAAGWMGVFAAALGEEGRRWEAVRGIWEALRAKAGVQFGVGVL
ncbi:uncharacterized protein E0L32_002458 [Thyridium curvatum]|uniref:Uncharacterized protein n=1 Tax=Thyridium curvatum TaxID=1093900 RepID=A0A507BN01_9PEZI|nr:uncharacterized protein E0L32_002458 [Thyridium curvatum]TPX18601.1 hypothetical protein E0L32_002458 [Thyridium curvatum]